MDMQSTARKVTAIFVAAMMVFAMAFIATPAKAFAAGETGTLTVTGNAELAKKNVTIVKMFGATKSGANVAYTLEDAWAAFFKGLGETTMDNMSGEELSQAAYSYVSNMTEDSAELVAFAKEARKYARDNSAAFNALSTTQPAGEASQGKASAVFTQVAYGYYLAFPADGSTSADRKTDAMLVNVAGTTATWAIKSEYPTVDKTVADVNGGKPNVGGAAVGDKLTFTLISKVPDMSDYSSYLFNFVDTLSAGLTLDQASINVTVDGALVASPGDYTVDVKTVETDKTQLTISMVDFKNKCDAKAGKEIKVTYSATLNEKAVVDGDLSNTNTNEAKVEYSNNPDNPQGGKGESTTDKTYAYTFKFGVNKQNDKHEALADAQFKIWKDGGNGVFGTDDTALKFDDKQNGKFILNANGNVETITTTAPTGKFSVEGLEEGVYWLEETVAPDGYNKLAAPVKVVIEATYGDDGSLASHSVKYGDKSTDAAHGDHEVVVVNKTGSLLPETGGMGTILFTVVGALAIIGGVVWAVRRKRSVR